MFVHQIKVMWCNQRAKKTQKKTHPNPNQTQLVKVITVTLFKSLRLKKWVKKGCNPKLGFGREL